MLVLLSLLPVEPLEPFLVQEQQECLLLPVVAPHLHLDCRDILDLPTIRAPGYEVSQRVPTYREEILSAV